MEETFNVEEEAIKMLQRAKELTDCLPGAYNDYKRAEELIQTMCIAIRPLAIEIAKLREKQVVTPISWELRNKIYEEGCDTLNKRTVDAIVTSIEFDKTPDSGLVEWMQVALNEITDFSFLNRFSLEPTEEVDSEEADKANYDILWYHGVQYYLIDSEVRDFYESKKCDSRSE